MNIVLDRPHEGWQACTVLFGMVSQARQCCTCPLLCSPLLCGTISLWDCPRLSACMRATGGALPSCQAGRCLRTLRCSSAMERFEPAALDLWGATWRAGETYALQPGARRYESYERNFAGVVCCPTRTGKGFPLGFQHEGAVGAHMENMRMCHILQVIEHAWQVGASLALSHASRGCSSQGGSLGGQVGFGVALEHLLALGQDWVWARVRHLAALLRLRLTRLPGVLVHDRGRTLCGIVSFTKVGMRHSVHESVQLRRVPRTCMQPTPKQVADASARAWRA